MKSLQTLIVSTILATTLTSSAVTILFEDFEDSTISYTFTGADGTTGPFSEFQSSPNASGLFSDYVGRINYNSIDTFGTSGALTNTQGNSFFGIQDSGSTGTTVTLTWSGLDISNFGTSYTFSGFFGEADDPFGGQDWDATDSVTVWASVDGGGFQQIFGIESTNDNASTTPSVDTNFNGIGDGTEITNNLTQFSANIGTILGAGNSLDLEIRSVNLSNPHEDIAFDNILIEGTAIPEPSSTLLIGLGGLTLLARRRR